MTDWTTKTRGECEAWLDANKLEFTTYRGKALVGPALATMGPMIETYGKTNLQALRMACAAAEVRVGNKPTP